MSWCLFWMAGQGFPPMTGILPIFYVAPEKPVLYLINKVESLHRQEDELGEFYTLGADRFYKVSAEHGLGVGDFLSDLVALLPDAPVPKESDESDESVEQREEDDGGSHPYRHYRTSQRG